MTTTQTNPKAKCPSCNKQLDGATGLDEDTVPRAGDLSLCAYCCTISVFKPDLTLRRATDEEFAELDAATQKQIKLAQGLILAFNAMH